MTGRGTAVLAVVAHALLAMGLGGGPLGALEAGDLKPVPRPNLDQVEPAIADQLRALHAGLDDILARSPLDREALLAAYTDLGQTYLAYSMLEPGVAALENAMLLDPQDYRWPYFVARVAQETNDLDRAASGLRHVLDLEPGYLPALIRLGDLELSRQNLEAAGRWYQDALRVAPGSPAANYGLGKIAVSEGRAEDAVKHFESVLEVQPAASAVHYSLGLAYRDLGLMDEAREHLAARGEVSVRSYDPLADSLAERVVGASLFVTRGNVAFIEGNYDLAIQAYSKAIEAAPDNRVALQGLASSFARSGRIEEAIGLYRDVLERSPDDAVILYNLGTILSDAGRRDEAKEALEQALAISPDFVDARFNLGLLLEQEGGYESALEQYEAVLTQDPADSESRVRRAVVLAQLGRAESAASEIEAVIAQDPKLGPALLARAQIARLAGQVDESAAAYRTALAGAADDRSRAQAAFELGNLLQAGDPEGAVEAFERATAIAPEVAPARFALARALGRVGRFEDAARQFEAGLARDPRDPRAHLDRAMAWLLADRDRQALAALDASLAALGEDLDLEHLRARLLATSAEPGVRDPAAALAAAESLMRRAPSLDHAETVAMALAAGGRYDEAATLQEQVRERATALGARASLPGIERRLAAYRAGEPAPSPWKT